MAILYPPLNTLKPVAADLWIVDGPVIRESTRMTVIRLGGDLLIHSPTPPVDSLCREIAQIGTVRWIVGPSRSHYWWIPEWHAAYPDAEVFLAPGIVQQSRGRIDFPYEVLPRAGGYPWDSAIDTLPVASSAFTEVEFFHRASRTLVLTDLVQNTQPVAPSRKRLLPWMKAAAPSSGGMTADLRQRFSDHLPQLRAAIEAMIALDPARVIIAHGRWYESNGAAELRRAFDWLLR